MTDNNAQAAAPQPSAQPGEGARANLSYLYGTIGIEAVAAAVRYADKDAGRAPAAPRIDLRFVEAAI